MKKQVVLYTDSDAWECKACVFSEKVTTEKPWEQIFICHKNRYKFSEERCTDRVTNDQLVRRIELRDKKEKEGQT